MGGRPPGSGIDRNLKTANGTSDMTGELIIRPTEKDDLETVVRITEGIIQRKVAPNWSNLVTLQLAKPEGVCLVAEKNGEVIGFIFGDVKHGDFGLEHSGWIEMFGVDPRVMGRGVGRALAQAAFQKFREAGVREIHTAVRWDSGDLLAFFKDIGFSLSNHLNLRTRLE